MNLVRPLEQDHIGAFQLDRRSLKDQSTELLRNQIISGRIPPGTKRVERKLAALLGNSPM